jgi:hypothetical protein
VVEQFAATHGVTEVHLPVVLGPQVAEGGGDAPLGHHRVRFAEQAPADESGAGAGVVGGDGGAQAGATGSDDHHVIVLVLEGLFSRH